MQTYGTHYRTLGMLWVIYGLLMVCGVVFILVWETTLTLMWGALLNRVPNPSAWMTAFHLFLGATIVMALISAVFSLLAGFALAGGSGSSRKLALIAAAFGMLGTPPGVALGVFTVAVLLPLRPSV